MARQGLKKRWIAVVPEPIERSTFVHLSGAILWLLFWQWRPNTVEVWRIDNPIGSELLYAIYFIGGASYSWARFSSITLTFSVSDRLPTTGLAESR